VNDVTKGLDYAWLRADVDKATKNLMTNAAKIASVFSEENPEIRPEFVIGALSQMKTGVARRLFSYIAADVPDFQAIFNNGLAEIYEQKLPNVVHKLQKKNTRLPPNVVFSDQLKTMLRNARDKWKKVGGEGPVPIDYILGALITFKDSLDVLDMTLMEFSFDRCDLLQWLYTASDLLEGYNIELAISITGELTTTVIPLTRKATRYVSECKVESDTLNLTVVEMGLKQAVIGQDAAIRSVMRVLMAKAAGLKDPVKPVGVLLFAGYTGTGKTEIARQLSAVTNMPMLRLDMSEYSEKHTVAKLYGSPPGYVGYGDGGRLTNFVKQNPCSVIVFDEVDKAHPDVMDVLLQLAEEGTLADGGGATVLFDKTIIIITTNIGATEAARTPIGFGSSASTQTSTFKRAIEKRFKPELLGRLSETVIFERLSAEAITRIAELEMGKLAERVKDNNGAEVNITKGALEQIVIDSDTLRYGAREVKNTVLRTVGTPLAEFIVKNSIRSGTINISYIEDKYVFKRISFSESNKKTLREKSPL
jgi:ATP-dependent Clp protease ATP-binding subunit ClpA